jgi:hypothetical protein
MEQTKIVKKRPRLGERVVDGIIRGASKETVAKAMDDFVLPDGDFIMMDAIRKIGYDHWMIVRFVKDTCEKVGTNKNQKGRGKKQFCYRKKP